MAPHSSTLAWKIPWTEEPGRLPSVGSRTVGHNWATSLSLFTFLHWRRKWNPRQCSCLENPRDGGAWGAAVYGVAQSCTRLKWLNSSSSNPLLVTSFVNIFFHFVGCLFILFMLSFAVQKIFWVKTNKQKACLCLVRSHLLIFVFISISLEYGLTEMLL